MKKTFIMVCTAIALVSCGGRTAPTAADVVSDTVEQATAQTEEAEEIPAAEAVTAQLDEQLKSGDAKTLAKTLADAKATIEKLQSEGKADEAAAYSAKLKEYVDTNKEALNKVAKGDVTVAELVNGIANLPANLEQGAAEAQNAAEANAAKAHSDLNAAKAKTEAAVKATGEAIKQKTQADYEAAKKKSEQMMEANKNKLREAANKKLNETLNKALGE